MLVQTGLLPPVEMRYGRAMTSPYSDKFLRDILRRTKVIALVGVSANPVRASNFVARYLGLRGYRVLPINPAYAGAESQNMVAISSRNQWNAVENSPKNQIITFSSQRKNNVGLGVSISSSKFFVERNIFIERLHFAINSSADESFSLHIENFFFKLSFSFSSNW